MLNNGDTYRIFKLRGLDTSAEAEPGGFRTSWASGSLGVGPNLSHFSGLGKEEVLFEDCTEMTVSGRYPDPRRQWYHHLFTMENGIRHNPTS